MSDPLLPQRILQVGHFYHFHPKPGKLTDSSKRKEMAPPSRKGPCCAGSSGGFPAVCGFRLSARGCFLLACHSSSYGPPCCIWLHFLPTCLFISCSVSEPKEKHLAFGEQFAHSKGSNFLFPSVKIRRASIFCVHSMCKREIRERRCWDYLGPPLVSAGPSCMGSWLRAWAPNRSFTGCSPFTWVRDSRKVNMNEWSYFVGAESEN